MMHTSLFDLYVSILGYYSCEVNLDISGNMINLASWRFQPDGAHHRDFLFLSACMHNTFRIRIAIPRDVSIQRPRSPWTAEKRKYIVTNDSIPATEAGTYRKQMKDREKQTNETCKSIT